YCKQDVACEDEKAAAHGKSLVDGNYSRAAVEGIYRWKTKGRGISLLRRNSDGEMADALRLACSATTARSALAVLTGLRGVDVSVASAILTAMMPDKYTIIDYRALEALDTTGAGPYSVDYYLAYLAHCQTLAGEYNVDLRTLDRALWQWSKERKKRRRSG